MQSDKGMHLHLYGIRNCDSCRRAVKWLHSNNVPHTLHDFREEGLSRDLVDDWLASSHGPMLLNRRSTTWRQLSTAQKQAAERDPASLIMDHPTLLKRPVITDGENIVAVGFEPTKLEHCI
jgi:Spx/MgsR family transcriptional regulator